MSTERISRCPWPPSVSAEDRERLERLARASVAPHRLVRRARYVLLAAEGRSASAVARALGTTPRTVRLWCDRFVSAGIDTLGHDAPGRGRPPGVAPVVERAVLAAVRDGHPPDGRRWTVRSLARAVGASRATVHRVCTARGLGSQF